MARHRAIEGILFSPKQRSVRQIKRLVEIDMRRGDIEEARKYLNLLDATLFYHSWARSKEEQLKGEETLSMEKRLPRKSDLGARARHTNVHIRLSGRTVKFGGGISGK